MKLLVEILLTLGYRVKLPKTFLAVNLSEAFTFEEQDKQANDNDVLEMKATPSKDLLTSAAPLRADNAGLAEGGKVVNPE